MLNAWVGKRKEMTWLREAHQLRCPAFPVATANCFLAGHSCFLLKSGPWLCGVLMVSFLSNCFLLADSNFLVPFVYTFYTSIHV